MGRYIGKAGLERLHKYVYRGEDHSPLSKYFLNPYIWSKAVLLLPSWLAPNTVTLLGFLFILLSYALSWNLCPGLLEPLPAAASLLFSVNVILYQTLDSIDGKQARRTNSSSPLGELFDHGCDSLLATLVLPPLMAALQAGPRRCLFLWLFSTSGFYMTTWETLHTGVTRLPVINAPTEGLIVIALILALIPITGTELFLTPLPHAPWWLQSATSFVNGGSPATPVDCILVGVMVLFNIPTLISIVLEVRTALLRKAQGTRGGGPGLASSLLLALPFWALVGCTYAWALTYPEGLVSRAPHLFLLVPCFAMGLMATHLNLAHVTGEVQGLQKKLWQPLMLQPLALLNMVLAYARWPHLPERLVFAVLLLDTGFLLYRFTVGVIEEICSELGICCFSIAKKKTG